MSEPWTRSKAISFLLALFSGPCTWLYTLRRDAWKASMGLGLISGFLAQVIFVWNSIAHEAKRVPSGTFYDAWMVVVPPLLTLLLVLMAVWIWAIIDTIRKPREWYKEGKGTRSKRGALWIAIVLGLWTWLYSYANDGWKFWFGLVASLGGSVVAGLNGFSIAVAWLAACVLVWIIAIVNVAMRPGAWYESYASRT